MGRRNMCVCGRLAEKPLPKSIDGLFVEDRAHEMTCGEYYWPGRLTKRVIEGAGLSRFLEAQLYADEVGIGKPDRRIFMKLCDSMGVSSEEAAHAGDELMEDIGGAISSGMKAILIKRDAERLMIIVELGLAIIPRLSDLGYVLMMLQQGAET